MIGRKDIPEGALEHQIPAFGYGRILSLPSIREVYVTIKVGRLRVLWSRGNYGPRRRSSVCIIKDPRS